MTTSTPAASDPVMAPRRLVLLRHAKAEPGGSVADMLRPLALTGRKQAAKVGVALVDAGIVPDRVLCSSALRTRQTWDIAALQIDRPQIVVDVREDLYSAGVEDILTVVRQTTADVETLLVIGHEPTMAAAAEWFADRSRSDAGCLAQVRVGVPTATYSVLTSTSGWQSWGKQMADLHYVGRPR